MAEQDNRRSGGESRVGHPASRRTSRLRDATSLLLAEASNTKSGNRGKNRKSQVNVEFVEPNPTKRALRSDKSGMNVYF